MIKKKCVVCGKEIDVASPFYCLCSDECRKIIRKQYNEKQNEKRRQKRIQNYTVPCRICGEPVPPTFHENRVSRSHYHEKCVLLEAMQAVKEGCGQKDKRIKRAWNRYSYTIGELRDELENYH